MKTLYCIYQGDVWLSERSLELHYEHIYSDITIAKHNMLHLFKKLIKNHVSKKEYHDYIKEAYDQLFHGKGESELYLRDIVPGLDYANFLIRDYELKH